MFYRLLCPLLALLLMVQADAPQIVIKPDVRSAKLADLLIVHPNVQLFGDYLRDCPSSYGKVVLNPVGKFTIFAPKDSSILSMSRKPHQGAVSSDLVGVENEKDNLKNLDDWVSSHIVPDGPLSLDNLPTSFPTLTKDQNITVSRDDNGNLIVNPGHVKILSQTECVDGSLFVLDSYLTFE